MINLHRGDKMTDETDQDVSYDGIALLRDTLLPNLLKEDQSDILYWAGKELAREFSFADFAELERTMEKMSFGRLKLEEEKKSTYSIQLTGLVVKNRLEKKQGADFSLETGFLAQAIQQLTGHYSEGSWHSLPKSSRVDIRIESDPKEVFTDQTS